jgi:hypothetical protein
MWPFRTGKAVEQDWRVPLTGILEKLPYTATLF